MTQRKTGIIGAMAQEIRLLRECIENKTVTSVAGMDFCEGTIHGIQVVLVQSGIGKVNAAICAQILIDRFAVTHIINTGIAGSLDERIDIGDVVLSTDAVYHDMDATFFGYQPGQVPLMKTYAFQADEAFRSELEAAVKRAAGDIHVYSGRVVSGDCFVMEQAKKDAIKNTFDGLCVEMEGTAIAHTAWVNQIPFVIVRFISDKANEESSKTYEQIEDEAANHSASIIKDALMHLA